MPVFLCSDNSCNKSLPKQQQKNIFLVIAAKITAGERGSVISVQSPVGGEWEHCDLLMLLLRETNYMSMLCPGHVCG